MSTSPLYKWRKDHELTLGAVAERFSVQKAAVWKWEKGQVAADKVLEVERVTGISRHVLRPDVFGPAPTASEAA